eukprot:c5780_g1_i1 orf=217-393(+)
MARGDLDILWRDYIRNPPQLSDDRTSTKGPKSPDFRDKQTREPLWMDGSRIPPSLKEE